MDATTSQPMLFGAPEAAPTASRVSHAALLARLADHLDAGLIVPCVSQTLTATAWTTDNDPALADDAAAACDDCPAIEICLGYAIDAAEPAGVWGGLTPGERLMRRNSARTRQHLLAGTPRSQAAHRRSPQRKEHS